MNVIIIAACIPTLRPLCLLVFNRPSASQYRPSLARQRSSYHKALDSDNSSGHPSDGGTSHVNGNIQNRSPDRTAPRSPSAVKKGFYERKRNNSILVDQVMPVESTELGSRDNDVELGDGADVWSQVSGTRVPLRAMETLKDEGTK